MNANNQNLGSNMAKVDAHEIKSQEYEELPELTEAGLERGVWKIAGKEVAPTDDKAAFCSALKNQKLISPLTLIYWACLALRPVSWLSNAYQRHAA